MSDDGTSRTPFEPARYLTKIGKADYLEVKWRLVWLRDVAPDAVIATEMISRTEKEAVFKATVTLPSGGSASGYATETMGDFRDFTEKCETKAIGRALAALGFGTQFSFDHDFDEGARRVVDSPVDPSRERAPARLASLEDGQTPATSQNGPPAQRTTAANVPVPAITPRQVKMIEVLIRQHGENPEDFMDRINTLTIQTASDWITDLRNGVMPWLKVVAPIPATPVATPVDADEALKALLHLDAPKVEQTAHWQYWVAAAGDDVDKWRTLAQQAERAIKIVGEKQGWRFTELMQHAPTEDVLDGLQKMAQRTNTWNPDLEIVLQTRFNYFLDQQVAATATT